MRRRPPCPEPLVHFPSPSTADHRTASEPPVPDALGTWPALISPEVEGRAFHRMRSRLLLTVIRQTLRGARFRVSIVALLTAGLWAALFWLFYDAFEFLDYAIPSPDLHDQTVRKVFGMFFVALMAMLVFSSAIILYGSLFKSPDVPFLFALPARPERVFLNKFQEALVMSSWAFVLLGSPMLLAYGMVARSPWYYYAMLLPFLIAFVYIPAALGALACLVVVHRLPQRGRHVLLVAGLVVVAVGVRMLWSVFHVNEGDLLTPGWFEEMLGRFWIAEYRLLPSWWLSTGLLQATQRDTRQLADSVMFLVLLISNALFLRQVSLWTAAAVYRAAYSRLHGRHFGRRRSRVAVVDRIALGLTRFLAPQLRLLIVKDLRLFRRDPVQWSQFLIFFSLLVLYFFNIRSFTYDIHYVGWVSVVSFLNVSVVGLLLSTFTTRFIFPLLSLEGRRFWLLGLLPVARPTIVWSKFAFAVGASLAPSSFLILLSDVMLRVGVPIAASHQLACLVLCLGLAGIAVGLGAKMPSLRETSPARIAAGFGGTLCLVLSTLYILAVVLLAILPCHFYFASGTQDSAFSSVPTWLRERLQLWLLGGMVLSILLGALATIAPLAMGIRAFRRTEF